MGLPLVDTHFHLDLFADPGQVVKQLDKSENYVVAVTNAPSVFSATSQLVGRSPRIRAALGLHPELVMTHAKERSLMWELFAQTKYIGEVGLDYVTQDETERKLQREVFVEIVERASTQGEKILTVHSRRAGREVIEILRGLRGAAILHWFSGTAKELTLALDLGLYFSVNPTMCSSNNGRRVIARIPRERLLTETDGPFVQVGKRPAVPDDINIVVAFLAELWACEPDSVKSVILANLRRITQSENTSA